MSFTDFKVVTVDSPGTSAKFGGRDTNDIFRIFNGLTVANRRPKIANPWIWLNYFDVKAPGVTPDAPADTNTNRIYTDPSDFKLKIRKTAGNILDIENINIPNSALQQITDKAKLHSQIGYKDETSWVTDAMVATHTSTKVTITAKGQLNSNIVYEDEDNTLGDHYLEFGDIAAPSNPASGSARVFLNSANGELSVRKSGGTTVTLEGGGGAINLNDLADVVITTPADNHALTYDSGSGTWINEAQTGGGGGGDVFLNASNTHGDFDNTFRSSRLIVRDSDNTHGYLLAGSNLAANRTVTFPLLTGNDTLVTEAFAQTLTNKTIAAGSNTISGIADAHISAHTTTKITTTAKGQLNTSIVYEDEANTFGDFDNIFRSSRLIVRNPANTFSYIIAGSAITTANRTITLPLLTGNDTAVMEAFTQTLTNKTVNTTDNTVTATSQATGDILKNNGTKFVRMARGSGLQVLRTNSGATDLEWASLDSERIGKSTANGNASTTVFNIAHGVGANPTYAIVSVAQSGSTNLDYSYTTDATNIVVTFTSAPSSGTNNVVIYWIAVA